MLINNHTSVWGSWWKDGVWGYACCHQCVKNSYCTGTVGVAAVEESAALAAANMDAHAARSAEEEEKRRRESKLNDYKGYAAGAWGDATENPEGIDPVKVLFGSDVSPAGARNLNHFSFLQVKEALAKLEKKEAAAVEADGSKRKFNSLDAAGENVTPCGFEGSVDNH